MFDRRQALIAFGALGGALAIPARAVSAAPFSDRLTGNLSPVHDPCIIKADGIYHIFSTSRLNEGPGAIHWRTSKDLINWELKGAVMTQFPAWVKDELPDTRGAWAPDIIYAGGRYRLYYSLSMFGKNTSRIAMLSTPTLDTTRPEFSWRDDGVVVRSETRNDYNAIDSHAFIDDDGRHWLSWGSFWSGIKLDELDPKTGLLLKPKALPRSLVKRDPPGAVEAPVIFKRGGYYYLFVSYDFCCRGVNSTYHTVVGRSKSVTGPYADDRGKPMKDGGGRIVLHANLDPSGSWNGPGHCDVFSDEGRDYIVYHAYDGHNGGRATLRINTLTWTGDGWPVAS
ncbi:arabinan endo-1,5-alpha-L-arabinosidase [Asticcacaulis sp. ZE23SCel15]|uniref:arabinan endo-1,5-alpha-L-arabinosidase n=1 Tax=Asticcacaulis sp. ZE23SCel15 TaxID=3059027 RepID=UPI00265F180D|nr:arabinan endo-1,5-alpha-L-arabinosidase [Asticcacaulis sp. ZE23SCel15]WKL57630.1 arabinan endo-1,5-alpha-L-arabinosidase [Asticcacaulis sp. ZE23SCel15]